MNGNSSRSIECRFTHFQHVILTSFSIFFYTYFYFFEPEAAISNVYFSFRPAELLIFIRVFIRNVENIHFTRQPNAIKCTSLQ